MENEMAVLGSVMLEPSVIDDIASILSPADFASEHNRDVFMAMQTLAGIGDPIDIISVGNQLCSQGQEGLAGSYLSTIIDVVPSAARVEYYAGKVKEKSTVRRLCNAAENILAAASDGVSAADLIELSESQILDVRSAGRSGPVHVSVALGEAFTAMEKAQANKGGIAGVPTGFSVLDNMLNGLEAPRLYVVAARPGGGKSALAVNLIDAACFRADVPTLLFTLEMGRDEIAARCLSSESRVRGADMRRGMFAKDECQRMMMAADKMHRSKFYVEQAPGLTISEIKATARRCKRQHDIGLIVVDYLQLAKDPTARSRENEVSSISKGLKEMAKELNVPVVALSQLNRDTDKRTNGRPILSDLRESGSIEQDADVVMFVNLIDESGEKRKGEIIIAKQRGGQTGTVDVVFEGQYTKFVGVEDGYR